MPLPEWLARQRKFAEFDRVAREVVERQFEESLFGLMLQLQEEAKQPPQNAQPLPGQGE